VSWEFESPTDAEALVQRAVSAPLAWLALNSSAETLTVNKTPLSVPPLTHA
jgi:hypothetical protein